MSRGRTVVVTALIAALTAVTGVTAPPVRAAPMTGVTFVEPARVLDSLPVTTGSYALPLGPPAGATQVLVQVTVVPNGSGPTGVVMAESCSVAPDPLTDVVLPIDPAIGVATNQMYVSVIGGACLTTTVDASRLIVDLVGWVAPTDQAAAAYVDVPFQPVGNFAGPTNSALDLTHFGVPPTATGVALWLDVLSTTSGFATLYKCGGPIPLTSQGNWVANVPTTILVAGVPTLGNKVCLFISDGSIVTVSLDGYYEPGATPTATSPPQVRYSRGRAPGFIPTSPTRLFDTRTAGIPVIGGQAYRLDLTPYVPPDTTAVVMNVTVTDPVASGYVSVYPCDAPRPVVSNLNYGPGQTVPNLVTVAAGSTLELCFFALTTTHLLADLAGYYRSGAGDGFAAVQPTRLFDTRETTKLVAGSVFEFNLSRYVAPDASAAVFNLTATEVDGPGYVTAFPCGQAPPLASNLNTSRGQTVPNLVTVALPFDKRVCFYTTSGTHLLADLAGFYAPFALSGFISITPTRWIDTRDLLPAPLPVGDIEGLGFDIDFAGATAMVFNATVTEPQFAGFLTAFPCGTAPPTASNLNFVTGQTVPNLVIAMTAGLDVCLFNSAPLHWIVDVSGFFTDQPVFSAYFPPGTDDT
jgi:hypothetical protein